MSLGKNTFHPLEIEDARQAAHRASELQREVEDDMRAAGRKLAEAKREHYKARTLRILKLKAEGMAITACATVAKGMDDIADLGFARDMAQVEYDAVAQQAFRRGADRKDVGRLLDWSMARDLRADTEPPAERMRTFGRQAA